MGNEYRTEKKILASELFDGRLKKFDIQEHDRGHSDRNYRCVSDGEKRLGVLINEVGYITGFVREWNGDWSAPEKILSAVSDAFHTKISRYGEPEYHGFESASMFPYPIENHCIASPVANAVPTVSRTNSPYTAISWGQPEN